MTESKVDLFAYERDLYSKGAKYICGVDEAGRGPLAGPVCIASCILPEHCDLKDINDSKKLTKKKREELFEYIKSIAIAYKVVFKSAEEIDKSNIYEVTRCAMKEVIEGLEIKPDYALIDFMPVKSELVECISITHGDALSASIGAASILAKVTRDKYMDEMDKLYPEYGFKNNAGYGTRAHLEALEMYGPSPIHRCSFSPVKEMIWNKEHPIHDLFDDEIE